MREVKTPSPPRAKRCMRQSRHHGIPRQDPYGWLRDDNWAEVLKNPKKLSAPIRAHLEEENLYAASSLAHLKPLRARLSREMRRRVPKRDRSVPEQHGAWLYYRRYAENAEHPLCCRKLAKGGRERVLLSAAARAKTSAFYRLGEARHAPTHDLFAWSEDRTGGERYEILFRDLTANALLPDSLQDANGSFAFAADGRTIFYILVNEEQRPFRVMRHRIGAAQKEDALVYEEKDKGFFLSLSASLSGDYLMIASYDHDSSETRLIKAHEPDGEPKLVQPRQKGVEYWLSHDKENARFLIRTNRGGAVDFKIAAAPEKTPAADHWRDIVPARDGVYLAAHHVCRSHLVWLEREEAQPRIMIRDHQRGETASLAFEKTPCDLSFSEGLAYDARHLRVFHASPASPERVYDFDLASGARELRKKQILPSGHDSRRYAVKRLFAPARDGESVPITLLYRRDKPPSPKRPLLLYGYGAYGIAIPASFSAARLSLADRGMACAIAHIRGGSEKGRRWHLDGRGEKKIQTFNDFIDAAEHLAAEGLAARGRIAAHGGSAGGLLMGAVANMAPSLFSCVIAEVPFVDALATMLDASLPLTPPEWPEWGNPIKSKLAYQTIAAYSPCDNVAKRDYPPILATAGLSDPRVGYWEPAKWIARLRDENPEARLFLKTNMEAGHGGASGRLARLDETAFIYAFALSC